MCSIIYTFTHWPLPYLSCDKGDRSAHVLILQRRGPFSIWRLPNIPSFPGFSLKTTVDRNALPSWGKQALTNTATSLLHSQALPLICPNACRTQLFLRVTKIWQPQSPSELGCDHFNLFFSLWNCHCWPEMVPKLFNCLWSYSMKLTSCSLMQPWVSPFFPWLLFLV